MHVTGSENLTTQYIEEKHYARLVVVCLTFEEISNFDVKCVKVTTVQNIGQGHRVKVPAESVHQEDTMQGLVVVGLIVEKKWNVDVKWSF